MVAPDPHKKTAGDEDDPRSLVDRLHRAAIEDVAAEVRDELEALESADPDEQWFEPEDLARLTHVELREDGGLLRSSAESGRRADARGLRIGALPGWPEGSPCGAGVGPEVDAVIGAVRPGDVIAVDADRRGVADALVVQIAEALAVATPEVQDLSGGVGPRAVVLHGAGADDLLTRRRGRWGGAALETLRGQNAQAGAVDPAVEEAWRSRLCHVAPKIMYGDELLEQLVRDLDRWTAADAEGGGQLVLALTGLAVWERYQDAGSVPAERESAWLMQVLRTARGRGWIVLAACRCARGAATFQRAREEGLVRAGLSIVASGRPRSGLTRGEDDATTAGAEAMAVVVQDERDAAPPRRVEGFKWEWTRARISFAPDSAEGRA